MTVASGTQLTRSSWIACGSSLGHAPTGIVPAQWSLDNLFGSSVAWNSVMAHFRARPLPSEACAAVVLVMVGVESLCILRIDTLGVPRPSRSALVTHLRKDEFTVGSCSLIWRCQGRVHANAEFFPLKVVSPSKEPWSPCLHPCSKSIVTCALVARFLQTTSNRWLPGPAPHPR
jgi:hypothetical protein